MIQTLGLEQRRCYRCYYNKANYSNYGNFAHFAPCCELREMITLTLYVE